jgi:hypothetical protein
MLLEMFVTTLVQPLPNAAKISFAEPALLHDQNQMLTRMNNEAKVR